MKKSKQTVLTDKNGNQVSRNGHLKLETVLNLIIQNKMQVPVMVSHYTTDVNKPYLSNRDEYRVSSIHKP